MDSSANAIDSQAVPVTPTAALPTFDSRERALQGELERQRYRVGPLNLLVAFDGASSLVDIPPLARIPHAHRCLCGLANVRGRIMPVYDAAPLFEVDRNPVESRYMLVIESTMGPAALTVDGVPATVRLDLDAMVVPPALPPTAETCLAAAYSDGAGGLVLDIDHAQLLEQLKQLTAAHIRSA